jgi:hypothetical protein
MQTMRRLSLVFGLWLVGISGPLAIIAADETRRPIDGATIVHVLAADCACSQAVAEHLLSRGADPAELEHVWIVGDAGNLGEQLAHKGYRPGATSAEEVRQRLGIAAAPLLVVFERGGSAALYAGGYSPHRLEGAGDARVASIVSTVRAGKAQARYPVHGCENGLRRARGLSAA